jgi:hypothetical protein
VALKTKRTRAADRLTVIEETDISEATPEDLRAHGFGEDDLDQIERDAREFAPWPRGRSDQDDRRSTLMIHQSTCT